MPYKFVSFLMYRMELKEALCGLFFRPLSVPNVPYGVERSQKLLRGIVHPEFLMYRMELKEQPLLGGYPSKTVPNVPYGVERLSRPLSRIS